MKQGVKVAIISISMSLLFTGTILTYSKSYDFEGDTDKLRKERVSDTVRKIGREVTDNVMEFQ